MEPEKTKSKLIHGIVGLAEFLGISHTTAQKLKNEGRIPYHATGKKLYFIPEEVHEATKQNAN